MAEFRDVERLLIEQTKSGELDWEPRVSAGGGLWQVDCGEVHFFVREITGSVNVSGGVPVLGIGTSAELLNLLRARHPLDYEREAAKALEFALNCLRENAGQ